MSKSTEALEVAVAEVIANMNSDGSRGSARQRANIDRAFIRILKIAAPRIRHFIRQYGLAAHYEDAEQVCAIAVHRAIEAYDPTKAKFTTFLNWQIRGELQSLRFRLMTDQRPSARKVEAVTIALTTGSITDDGEETSLEALIEDEAALERTESSASEHLANQACIALVDAYIEAERKTGVEQLRKRARTRRPARDIRESRPDLPASFRAHMAGPDPVELEKLHERLERDRAIIERSMFSGDTKLALSIDTSLTRERIRQIVRRAGKHMAQLVQTDPRFAMLAEQAGVAIEPATATRPATPAAPVGMLPSMNQPHNQTITVSVPAEPAADRRAVRGPSVTPVRHQSGGLSA
ncbi:sigma factor [Citromicrobium bathyomarinum]|uniref:sigma factor n=1 Tax=unclassified Citromicrobium TaxID=2630544 RepID=UPI0006C90688|nr:MULTISPECIES: sigma factor [unclassified Citromicrobium]KPM22449.1 RNA polymerase subunit sigma-70 [Citromicrobium sp. RCC1885]KPM25932.1 RNA polymerase subunit sigma-70 [Citromicrobium sp. RCC1878]MAO03171.1 RNA polymerase subunit sigma-70 [Citromicrobium sp.]OAM07993.1 RNA polymerase subunit sigma-70 [Citromicrobium sp. RCC1897]|tara:strand:- start:1151 stop:2203 length:1053 start_codon:yes stop_codon:yes gene_type:complete